MDDVIFEEFKATGNMELRLDRRLVDKRIFPAIDIEKSSTRREDLLLSDGELQKAWLLRRALSSLDIVEAIEKLTARLKKIKTNSAFFKTLSDSVYK